MAQEKHAFLLQGLSCADCALKIESTLKQQGYSSVSLNFTTRRLYIGSDDITEINSIISKIEPGAIAIPEEDSSEISSAKKHERKLLMQIFASILLLFLGVILTSFSLPPLVITGGYLALFGAYFVSGFHVLRRALFRLQTFDIANEYFLMSVATIGAIIIKRNRSQRV